ncbi:MAG: (Fe-S)-binding protein, partial [Verrucomicrobiota bacterium]
MALTGMAIYKLLPRTNCGDCKFPTCMAFAMQVAAKQKALTDCPHLSEQAKAELADASTPPMKLVHIGPADKNGVIIGQETVMFRHEKKFHNPPALAIKIPSSLSEKDALARLEEINKAVFARVGAELGARLAAVEIDGLSPDAAGARVKALAAKRRTPFVIIGENPEVMKSALSVIANEKP